MKFTSIKIVLFVSVFAMLFFSCSEEKPKQENTAFSKLDSKNTGIEFSNDLTENDSLNYFTYAYIYMGGGVSAGDINNDGLVDLFFTGNMVENKLYLNKGNLQFEDISQSSGLQGDSRWYTGTTMIDINNLKARLRVLKNETFDFKPTFTEGGTISEEKLETEEDVLSAFAKFGGADYWKEAIEYYQHKP